MNAAEMVRDGRVDPAVRRGSALSDQASPGARDAPVATPWPSDPSGWTDAALMAAVVLRDGEAYTELYRRHSTSVAAATRMILGNGPECDDVVTAVFLAVWATPERFDATRGSLISYLRLTARGRSIDLLRAETGRRRREQADVHAPRAPAPEVDAALIRSESAEQIRRAVSSLPAAEGEAIRLAFFGDMSYRSVAQFLGQPEGTVKSRIRSGLQRLREHGTLLLAGDGSEEMGIERTYASAAELGLALGSSVP